VIPALVKVVATVAQTEPRLEAATTIGARGDRRHAELLIELLGDPLPGIRGGARALARVDPDLFIATLAGLEPDQNWSVRVRKRGSRNASGGTQPAAADDAAGGPGPARRSRGVEALAAASRGLEKILIEKLQADDFAVRGGGGHGAGRLKSAAACRRCRGVQDCHGD
jgi:hypothetical protein